MRIATVQFAPELGQTEENILQAENILSASPPHDVDLLVLPELAFTGYNHTVESILPHLELPDTGISTRWAKSAAAKYNCIVSVGYPELATQCEGQVVANPAGTPTAYNSLVTVSPAGKILANYRKFHLYYTDASWASEGPDGFMVRDLPLPSMTKLDNNGKIQESVRAAFGICMDINPYQFTAPQDAYEFCVHAINGGADMLVLSMAWLSALSSEDLKGEHRGDWDMDTWACWLARLLPFIEAEKEVIVIFADRCGEEPGENPFEKDTEGVRYAGTSWVGKIGRGDVGIWRMLGRGEEGLLLADTSKAYEREFRAWRPMKGEGYYGTPTPEDQG
ncbi:uncharacterized protein KY384_003795 [Bacidia gigantensis]|uniref:uncharacterized protein n=1 Tax=Bacidia gigantensis TaxID=2732470 RepID=UPI001D03D717|nr:uncharacterized protein KY384_003795 [Bacidia gigantensis]KAG8532155.1 hypothetical protein KY384_003795 [Bacidia gigantensis]